MPTKEIKRLDVKLLEAVIGEEQTERLIAMTQATKFLGKAKGVSKEELTKALDYLDTFPKPDNTPAARNAMTIYITTVTGPRRAFKTWLTKTLNDLTEKKLDMYQPNGLYQHPVTWSQASIDNGRRTAAFARAAKARKGGRKARKEAKV